MSSDSKWNSNLSQDQYMLKDQCILLDMNDQIVGSQSKKTAHVFDTKHRTLYRSKRIFFFVSHTVTHTLTHSLTSTTNLNQNQFSHKKTTTTTTQHEDNYTEHFLSF